MSVDAELGSPPVDIGAGCGLSGNLGPAGQAGQRIAGRVGESVSEFVGVPREAGRGPLTLALTLTELLRPGRPGAIASAGAVDARPGRHVPTTGTGR